MTSRPHKYLKIILALTILVSLAACDKLSLTTQKQKFVYKDYTELSYAASNYDVQAMYELASIICCGNNENHNNKKAYMLYCEAAKKGHSGAQYELGKLYENGVAMQLYGREQQPFLIPQDKIKSYMWYSVAAQNDNEQAMSYKKDLAKNMSIADINKSMLLRKNWQTMNCDK